MEIILDKKGFGTEDGTPQATYSARELAIAATANGTPARTLAELKLSSENVAKHNGYICLSPRAFGRLWLAGAHYPAVLEKAAALRTAEQQNKHRQAELFITSFKEKHGVDLDAIHASWEHKHLKGLNELSENNWNTYPGKLAKACIQCHPELRKTVRLNDNNDFYCSVPAPLGTLILSCTEVLRILAAGPLWKETAKGIIDAKEQQATRKIAIIKEKKPQWISDSVIASFIQRYRLPSLTIEKLAAEWVRQNKNQCRAKGLWVIETTDANPPSLAIQATIEPLASGVPIFKGSVLVDAPEVIQELLQDPERPLSSAIAEARKKAESIGRLLVDEVLVPEIWSNGRLAAISPTDATLLLHKTIGSSIALLHNKPMTPQSVRSAVRTVLPRVLEEWGTRAARAVLPQSLFEFYPVARSMRRTLKLVQGPTNSGKTWQALERLKKAESGLYLGPLRLLALEVRDKLKSDGVPVSLRTGELVEEDPFARHTASTVEMLDLGAPVEVAVIDEVQMLADPERGNAWLQAILGVPAKEVWLIGSPEAESAVRFLAKKLGEHLEVITTRRLAPLEVAAQTVSLVEVPRESAVIAFTRRDVHAIAGELKKAGYRPAIIYGALSPAVRIEQSQKFIRGEADVVVATDAIGMGLNLPIKTVVFTTLDKWNGTSEEALPSALIRQIAGRAGRYGIHEAGVVTGISGVSLGTIQKALSSKLEPLDCEFAFGPSLSTLQPLAQHLESRELAYLLGRFKLSFGGTLEPYFHPEVPPGLMQLAVYCDRAWPKLTLEQKFVLSSAPVKLPKGYGIPQFFMQYAEGVQSKRAQRLDPSRYHSQNATLDTLEDSSHQLTVYAWLHYRMPELFPDLQTAHTILERLSAQISGLLAKVQPKKCQECGTQLTWKSSYKKCDSCYREQRRWGFQQ